MSARFSQWTDLLFYSISEAQSGASANERSGLFQKVIKLSSNGKKPRLDIRIWNNNSQGNGVNLNSKEVEFLLGALSSSEQSNQKLGSTEILVVVEPFVTIVQSWSNWKTNVLTLTENEVQDALQVLPIFFFAMKLLEDETQADSLAKLCCALETYKRMDKSAGFDVTSIANTLEPAKEDALRLYMKVALMLGIDRKTAAKKIAEITSDEIYLDIGDFFHDAAGDDDEVTLTEDADEVLLFKRFTNYMDGEFRKTLKSRKRAHP